VSIPRRQRSRATRRAPRLLLGRLADRALELLDPRVDEIDRVQVAVEGDLLRRELEALLGKPVPASDGPRARRQRPPQPQAELREPMPVTHPIKTRVLAGAHQIASRLKLARGHMNRLQQPAGEQTGKLARVTAVGLNAITRPLRHQARRHHRAIDPPLDEETLQTEAGRARLLAATHHRPAAQHTLDRLLVVGKRPLLEQLVGAHRRQPHRARMHIQPNRHRRHRVVHGRRPPYLALPGHPRQTTTDA